MRPRLACSAAVAPTTMHRMPNALVMCARVRLRVCQGERARARALVCAWRVLQRARACD